MGYEPSRIKTIGAWRRIRLRPLRALKRDPCSSRPKKATEFSTRGFSLRDIQCVINPRSLAPSDLKIRHASDVHVTIARRGARGLLNQQLQQLI